MKYSSQISLIISTQLGGLQGRVESELLAKLVVVSNKIAKECPTVNELKQLVNLLDNIGKSLNNLERTKNSFRVTSNKLTPVINSLTVLVRVLRLLPIPTAVAGVGVPIGFTNRYAELLVDSANFLDAIKREQNSINKIVNGTDRTVNRISQLVETVNSYLPSCIGKNPELAPYLAELQSLQSSDLFKSTIDSNLDLGLGPANSYRASNGRDYFFEIITDNSQGLLVSRRLAVAKDITGVVVLRGSPSFSSSTKVLVDELKLRIERQLP